MLSGSAFLRIVVLLIVAAGLAGLVQAYWSATIVEPEPAVVAVDPPRPVRRADPVPAPAPPIQPDRTPAPAGPAPLSQAPAAPIPTTPIPAAPVSAPPVSAAPAPPRFAPPPSVAEDAADAAADSAGPRAMAIADLNTASVAELNGLRGGGMIGRSIVQKRPYASVDQLLSKRVLSRSTYERIKDQVTVR